MLGLLGAIIVVGALVVMFGTLAVIIILRGYVLSVLWRWFMMPILGLPELGIAQAIGIALVVGMLTHQNHYKNQNEDKDKDKKRSKIENAVLIVGPFLAPFATLLIGWIVRQCM